MKSNVTLINEALRYAGRDERLVRAPGYWRLRGGDAALFEQSGIYAWDPKAQTFEAAFNVVKGVFEAEGISLRLSLKVERTCPRCRARRHHGYSFISKRCSCAECSHTWPVRLLKGEWS